MSHFPRPSFIVLLLVAFGLWACDAPPGLEKADESVTALLSGLPSPESLPTSVCIKTDTFSAVFSGPADVKALNDVLGSALLSGSDPQVRRHAGKRTKVGTLTVTTAGLEAGYELQRATNDPDLWTILLPDRTHPSTSVIFFRGDGRFTTLLQAHSSR